MPYRPHPCTPALAHPACWVLLPLFCFLSRGLLLKIFFLTLDVDLAVVPRNMYQ